MAIARIELPRTFPQLPELLLNPLLECLANIPQTLASSSATTLLNTLWTINSLVKEWRTVKLSSGAEVMRSLEGVFVEPVWRVLQIWGESKKDGGQGEGWVLEEAGRYAFK